MHSLWTAIDQLRVPTGFLQALLVSHTIALTGCSEAGVTRIEALSSQSYQLFSAETLETESYTCVDLGRFVANALGGLSAEVKGPHGVGIQLQYRPALLRACMGNSEALVNDVIRGMAPEAMDTWMIKVPRMILGTDSTTSSAFMEYLFRSSGAARDIVLVVGSDTIPCGFVHLESTPALSQFHQLLIGFDVAEDERQRQVIWTGPHDLMGDPIHFVFREGVFAHYHHLVSEFKSN